MFRSPEALRRPSHHLSSAGLYLAANVLGRLQFFLTLPIVSRAISPAAYAVVTIANILAVFIATTVQASVSGAVERFYSLYTGEERRRYLGTILAYLFLACVGVGLLLAVVGPALTSRLFRTPVAFFPTLLLPLVTALINTLSSFSLALMRIEERPASVLGMNAVRLVVGTAGSWLALGPLEAGINGYFAALLLAELAACVCTVPYVLQRVHLGLRKEHLFAVWAFSLPLVPYVLMALARDVGDRWLLERRIAPAALGLYGFAWGMAGWVNVAVSSLSVPYGAVLMKRFGRDSSPEAHAAHLAMLEPMAADVLLFSASAYAFLLLGVREVISLFATPAYAPAAPIAMAIGIVFLARATYLLPHNALQWMGRTHGAPIATLLGLLVGAAVLIVSVPRLGVYAGPLGVGTAYLVAWVACRRYLPSSRWLLPAPPRTLGIALLPIIVAAAITWATTGWADLPRFTVRVAAAGALGVALVTYVRRRVPSQVPSGTPLDREGDPS